ncbi:type VI secretion system Vgr family protein [Paraburkholderia sp. DD10]|uniref:Type VI secretion system secreted protein VgrG n=1 Tax=Paraburkholderia terricola TaxID=169427 RepID=A0A1M6M9R1_9BURK|nr:MULTISPECIES: type VI secretion system Vgr family protein [Paraburkholderia]AXE91451.1 type VI secretion system tip protein VgrG [Paraburkholderia terricola]SDN97112.1 type VI secretion system secreted protein VgrG [Paraburkholderia sediminicola]SHJ80120.1 type VI secretion system secreted protein VgrG [Paraburkholderia terricola]
MGAQDLVSAINAGINQTERLLKLDTPLGTEVLVPQRAIGTSRIGRNFEFTVDAVSLRDSLELKTLIAQPVTLWIQTADKSYAPYHGYVYTARRLGSDGNLTTYQFTFASWMHFLRFRKDARIFQDKTVDEILSTVFNGHPQAQGAFRFDLRTPLPQRSFCVQYEDDWNFCQRLMESEGLFGYFEHADDGKSHTLVVTDDVYSLKPIEPETLQFSRAGTNTSSDAWVQWSGSRTLHSSSLSTRTFDYKSPGDEKSTNVPTLPGHGNLPAQAEVYEYTGAYTHLTQDRGDHLSKVRMEEWESRAKRFMAVGGVRNIDAGKWFQLEGHTEHDLDGEQQRQFAVIEARWYIENNLPVSATAGFPHSLRTELAQVRAAHAGAVSAFLVAHHDGSEGFYLVAVEAQRRTVPFRSPLEHVKPVMSLQTATVAGPANAEVFTDELNRIKVRFHWDRLNSGDENASCWVRVAYSDTGGAYGGVHVPRVGEEVIVSFLDGDCDRPIVSGRVFNSDKSPHWHSNGLLSGYKSKEYGGAGYNQLVMDDASGQNRVHLYSTNTHAHLHLGYLIEQSGNIRGSYLGSGFDLKSDAYGAVRAGQGLYVSTHPANGSSSQPLDVRETQQQLINSESVMEALSGASETHQAESLKHGHDSLKAFTDATQNSVSGTSSGGNTAGGGTGNANAFKEPVMLFGSPAGIALSTPRSTHVAADEQVNIVSGQNTHIATGKSLVASVAQRISLFVQNAGMKLFAAKGKVEIQAHSDNIELTTQKTLRLLSATEKVEAAANQEILLTSGGAYIRIAGGNIEIHAPGNIDIKGSQHSFNGPASTTYPLPALPTSRYNTAMQYLYHDDEPVQGAKYIATLADGSTRQGALDAQGRMRLEDVPVGPVKVELGPDARSYARKDRTSNPDFKGEQLSDADIDSLIQKHWGA